MPVTPPVKFVVDYNPEARQNSSMFFGASLKSMELLGREKGYQLVGCSFSGVNAFFVREDLTAKNFAIPPTAENFYEPMRRFLTGVGGGLERHLSSFKSI